MSWLWSGFSPHRYCLGGYAPLVWTHVISDLLIFYAYVSLSVSLYYFVYKRDHAPFGYVFTLFGHFILACACTHLVGAIVQWYPVYWIEALVKVWCAIISLIAAVIVIMFMPIAVKVNDIIWKSHDSRRLEELQSLIRAFEQQLFRKESDGRSRTE